jgi:polyphosphate glucokinase
MKGLTLCIDIGGSHIKGSVVDRGGKLACEEVEMVTPRPAPPARVIAAIAAIAARLPAYERISAGFPGVVRCGRVLTAPNLGTDLWHGFDLAGRLADKLKKPARVLNDAEVQGLGVISGDGLEFVVTLGTGFGSALFRNGQLMPHLELGQHPVWKRKTYDQYLGHAALTAKGPRKWNLRLERALGFLATLLDYDRLYLGGGNARKVTLRLPANAQLVANEAGITGGIRLWDSAFDKIFAEPKQQHRPLRRLSHAAG